MFSNYVKIAVRNLRRHKGYTFINVTGLAVGLACAALILLYVRQELRYDQYHSKADRIYRLAVAISRNNEEVPSSRSAAPMGPAVALESPEVLTSARVAEPWTSILVRYNDRLFYEPGVYYADPSLFDIFDFPFQEGDPATALRTPQSVLLSAEMAKKYFGDDDPLGKTLHIERGGAEYQVTGILKHIPSYSHLRPDFIMPFDNLGPQRLTNWFFFSYPTYVLLKENASPEAVERRFPAFVKRHYANAPSDFPKVAMSLQPLADIHFHTESRDAEGKLSPIAYMYLFSALACIILLVACFNFMNLATARSQERAKEVGVRKVMGGLRRHLIVQFLAESVLLSFAAVGVAVVLIEFFLPTFNALAQKDLTLQFGMDWMLVGGFIALAVIVGVGAGSYPAFFLSRFQPVDVLRGSARTGGRGARLRQLLVIGQFTLSIVLLSCTCVVSSQMEFIRSTRLGFDKDQVVMVQLKTEEDQNNCAVLKTELLRHPEILKITCASGTPADVESRISVAQRGDSHDEEDVYSYHTDYDFLATLGMKLASGRYFSPAFPGDSTHAIVLNEAAVKKFGWESAQAAIGQPFVWSEGSGEPREGMVVGVIEDFHFRPLYEEIAPAIFQLSPEGKNFLLMRVMPNGADRALELLKTEWRTFDANHPLEFSFLNEQVEAQYGAETRLLNIFAVFSGLAIMISCLGLFGLISFTTHERTKEIGIRKILGASVASIVLMLSRDFALLLLIAFCAAVPIAWYAMNAWLQNFAYHRPIDPVVFVIAGMFVLCIAWFAVSFQTVKAALANPVESLRYE